MAQLPLEGIRVLDLTVVWAGPYGTQLLADLGAEVIRIESGQFWQSTTRGIMPRPPEAIIKNGGPVGGGFPGGEAGDRPWNRASLFNCHARNKYSMTVDLQRPEGKEIFYDLVSKSDVFVENNEYETVYKLGIDYESLTQHRPDIIYLSSNGMGHTGPWKDFIGYGIQFESIFGHLSMTGYADMDPSGAPSSVAGDGAAGPMIAFAVMAALHHRNQTGKGQYIDMAQGENLINHLAEAYLDYSMNGRVAGPTGNRQTIAAPQGAYPTMGEDEWIVFSIMSDDEWFRFAQLAGRPEWATDPRYRTAVGRWNRHDELDREIAEWTRGHDNYALFHMMQAVGLRAGPIVHEAHAYRDPHLAERGFFVEMTQGDSGTHRYPGADWKFSETPVQFRKPPVMLGEDNEYVYKEVLGYSDERYSQLVAEGHVTMEVVETPKM